MGKVSVQQTVLVVSFHLAVGVAVHFEKQCVAVMGFIAVLRDTIVMLQMELAAGIARAFLCFKRGQQQIRMSKYLMLFAQMKYQSVPIKARAVSCIQGIGAVVLSQKLFAAVMENIAVQKDTLVTFHIKLARRQARCS